MYNGMRVDTMERKQAMERRYKRKVRRRKRKIKMLLTTLIAMISVCAFTASMLVLWNYAVDAKNGAADMPVAQMEADNESDLQTHDSVKGANLKEEVQIKLLSQNQINRILNQLPADARMYVEQILDSRNNQNKEQVNQIVEHAAQYPIKVLEMASKYPQTIPYAAAYLEKRRSIVENPVIDLTSDLQDRDIPLFIQWDDRWGYHDYGTSTIGVSGCGAAALSMIAVGLTGNTSANPKAIADFSMENGYITSGNSTQWTLFTVGAANYGLHCFHMPMNYQNVIDSLQAGRPIIASMMPGDFTKGGHFIVLTGLTSNGRIIVNDPNSHTNSQKTWRVEDILRQSKSMWSFSTNPF